MHRLDIEADGTYRKLYRFEDRLELVTEGCWVHEQSTTGCDFLRLHQLTSNGYPERSVSVEESRKDLPYEGAVYRAYHGPRIHLWVEVTDNKAMLFSKIQMERIR